MAEPPRIPIILTGTIVPPMAGKVKMAAVNPQIRRSEYLASIAYYRQFAPVYFIENSSYPLLQDPDFAPQPDFFPRQFPISEHPERGKGYQEFEMLDRWLEQEENPPPVWMKISGRYRIQNAAELLAAYSTSTPPPLVIDQSPLKRFARTYLFLATTAYYQKRVRGVYTRCDDTKGKWIERVLFRALREDPDRSFELFRIYPVVEAIQGTTGKRLSKSAFGLALRNKLRAFNLKVDRRYLRFSR